MFEVCSAVWKYRKRPLTSIEIHYLVTDRLEETDPSGSPGLQLSTTTNRPYVQNNITIKLFYGEGNYGFTHLHNLVTNFNANLGSQTVLTDWGNEDARSGSLVYMNTQLLYGRIKLYFPQHSLLRPTKPSNIITAVVLWLSG